MQLKLFSSFLLPNKTRGWWLLFVVCSPFIAYFLLPTSQTQVLRSLLNLATDESSKTLVPNNYTLNVDFISKRFDFIRLN